MTAPAFLATGATVTPAGAAPCTSAPPISLPTDDRSCQRWRHHHHTWQHRDGRPFDPDRFTVVELDTRDGKHAARHLIIDHHYAASWPAAMHCFGLIDCTPQLDDYPDPHPSALTQTGRLVGAAVLSVPQHVAVVAKPFPRLTPYREAADLGRFLLLDPVAANAESARCCIARNKSHAWPGRASWSCPVPLLMRHE